MQILNINVKFMSTILNMYDMRRIKYIFFLACCTEYVCDIIDNTKMAEWKYAYKYTHRKKLKYNMLELNLCCL